MTVSRDQSINFVVPTEAEGPTVDFKKPTVDSSTTLGMTDYGRNELRPYIYIDRIKFRAFSIYFAFSSSPGTYLANFTKSASSSTSLSLS